MNCVVTAGPTYEPLDEVRRLTNFSTGRVGTILAGYLAERGHSVVLLRSSTAVYPAPAGSIETVQFTTTADLLRRLESIGARPVDAVFHAAAVSDFAFGKVWARQSEGELIELNAAKIPTRNGDVLAELIPTPKLIGKLHELFPKAWLVGWKYEADGGPVFVMMRAEQQILENKTHACVMNGPAYGNGFGLLTEDGECGHHADLSALCRALADMLEQPEQRLRRAAPQSSWPHGISHG